ncbi:hypothetical protein ACFGVS_03270 [Mucilaginibacter sp. AW1-7]|uniref:hypothetical protein n=1 Tax=Mucilaginibacter sp. AW1-7 TaxID=3349874 RepID=UPI003F737B7B
MKTLNSIILTLVALAYLTSCKKEVSTDLDAGVVNVTNAVIGGSTVTLIADQSIVSTSNTVAVNNYAIIPIRSSENRLTLGTAAVAATSTAPAIPSVTYYNQPITITSESNYSLFLTGPSPSAVESVLIKETFPYAYKDSICAVRFINLAQGNTPVSVNIKGQANGSEAASVAYKAYTDFKQYPAKKINPNYIFEFRNAGTGTLITSYTLTTPYFHNVTLALRGAIGGSTGVILVNNY